MHSLLTRVSASLFHVFFAFVPFPLVLAITLFCSLDQLSDEEKLVSRQSYAGLLWTKQFYHYIIKDWLIGDPEQPAPPESRAQGRNSEPEWRHLFNRDIISMPDKWEYPWVSMDSLGTYFALIFGLSFLLE